MVGHLLILHAAQDQPCAQALDRHLSALKTAGLLDTWHAGRLLGGDDNAAELKLWLPKLL